MTDTSAVAKPASAGCSLCSRLGLRPFTKQNVLYFYAPAIGQVSYGALSVNVMNPALAIRLFPTKDVTNFLLLHTLAGTSLYLWSRPHLQSIEPKKRAAYSLLGSGLFGLGSVLLWAILRSAIPRNNAVATVVALGSGYAVARLGYDYVQHVDAKAIKAAA